MLSLRFAARELRSGVRGFRVFLACLALGVASIAAAGSTAQAFRVGLASQAREILGGDIRIGVDQRRFTAAERAAFERRGQVAYAVGTRAMAQAPSGDRRLVEIRGVSANYPLAGKVELSGAANLAEALAPDGDAAGAAVEQALMDRLHLKLGDRLMVGDKAFKVRAVLLSEPDRLGRGFALGPRVLTSLPAVEEAGFLTPGYLYQEVARVALPETVNPKRTIRGLRRAFPHAGFEARDRSEAAAGLSRLIDQLEYFLGFIGLASLVAGGLGVAGAVSAYLEQRKLSIAVLKALGAEGVLVRNLYLIQVGLLAMLGVAIGLVIGAVAPLILGWAVKDKLPAPALFAVYPWPLAKAALFGLLAAAAFSLGPLARARSTPPAALFRRELAGRIVVGPELVLAILAAAGLAALAIWTAPTPVAAGIMIAGVAISFVLLWLVGRGAAFGAGRARGLTTGPMRLGLANLAGPRSAARTASPAIGLGVALLAAVVLIQSALLAQVGEVAPRTAPALVFTEIPAERAAEFDAAVQAAFAAPLKPEIYQRYPFATGRITGVRGAAVNKDAIKPADRWAYDNDLSISAIGAQPTGAGVVAGRWWAADYAGPPLVALSQEAAQGAQLKVGDAVTLSLLGRDIEARVAALRKVDFGGFGPTFPIVVSPSALTGANLRNVAIAKADKAQEQRVMTALGQNFPQVNVISVREQLEAAADLFARLSLAIRSAAGVAALAGVLVLAGALAAGAPARAREAATLKVLGAARGQILAAYAVEYGAVGAIAGIAGVALGYAAARPVVTLVFKATWTVDWAGVAILVGSAGGLCAIGGLIAASAALAGRPAPVLRAD